MSSERKTLKIVSLITFVAAVVAAVFGVMSITAIGDLDAEKTVALFGATLPVATFAIVAACALVATAVVGVLIAAAGIGGANNPRKAGSAKGLAGIGILAGVVDAICGFVGAAGSVGTATILGVVVLVLAIAVLVYAGKVAEQAER